MPSILSDEDKQTVKRTVPKSANKIHTVAVAKLYIAYPDPRRWTYTGLQGAVVLANDLVGNTFWLKMVDISPQSRGVIWDQEIYDTFSYNQDRVFFHTFELEDCLAGLSFADEKEAKTFKKKLDDREKNAHKNTKNKPFSASAGSSAPAANGKSGGGHGHGLLGGLFGHRHSSAPGPPPASIIPPTNVTSPPAAGRDGLLADIRGGARLKKVSDSEKKDRSAAAVPGAEPTGGASGGASGAATPGDAGLAGALASALAARKSKVSHSDDESDKDDW
ncbi:hypothetical protein CUC08_Gglean007423 [Alternaria sp. MG1]|nr:hypothetical protein CUC08_Gglean007423 [Alternaria sp. MG1]